MDPFDVVIDMSHDWSDPTGMLADIMRAGKTVITVYAAPFTLGVDTDATVQAWIGANAYAGGNDALVSVARDPILGNSPPGTEVANCADAFCSALSGTSGHPHAQVLARFVYTGGFIGIMRNFWEGGVSVYMTSAIPLIYGCSPPCDQIILNAVEARNTIPTLNTWGLLALALTMGIAGAMVIHRRRMPTKSHPALPVLIAAAIFAAWVTTVRADVTSTQDAGVTYLRLGTGEPFRSTDNTVVNLRSVAIPNSAGVAVLWEETAPDGSREPFYAISLNGKSVDEVRATSYDLQLRYARFDPAVGQPAVPTSLLALADGELYIVQFVTQSLSAFRAAVEAQGAVIYDFLPNHAHIARVAAQARRVNPLTSAGRMIFGRLDGVPTPERRRARIEKT